MVSAAPVLAVSGIRKSFGAATVLRDVDLSLHSGEVLALLGENGAGKSTLMKIIAGDHRPDAGTIGVGGDEFTSLDPVKSRSLGIRMIFQELNDASTLTVAENICLGRWPVRRGRVDWKAMRGEARSVLKMLDVDIDLDRPVASLRLGERQILEIARALSDRAKILILDEPTAALSASEADKLFAAIGRMRDDGVGMIYITHRLDEVARLADRVQVLRDGSTVLDDSARAVSRSTLISAMIGRPSSAISRPDPMEPSQDTSLRMSAVSAGGAFEDISLTLSSGEILALYGKIGSGTAEVAEVLFGLRSISSGSITLKGRPFMPTSPFAAIRNGIGYLPPDRQQSGCFAVRPVAENLCAPSWKLMARRGWIRRKDEHAIYQKWQDVLGIRGRREPAQPIAALSGGNQQKVLLGRWLERDVDVLVVVEPTRGVDVGAREDIYRAIRKTARQQGVAVLAVTSDYEEVVQLGDRAAVMRNGRVVKELEGDDVSPANLTEAAGG